MINPGFDHPHVRHAYLRPGTGNSHLDTLGAGQGLPFFRDQDSKFPTPLAERLLYHRVDV